MSVTAMLLPYFFIPLLASAFGSPKIAIIGGGISGSTVAFRLRKLFPEGLELDLYEADKIGGRMVEVQLSNATYDIGASLFHANNLYMKKLVSTLELERRTLPIDGEIEIWYKNRGIVRFPSTREIYQHYGYVAARASEVMGEVLEDEMKIYSCQAQGAAYRGVRELIEGMGRSALKASAQSLLDLFRSRFIAPAFIYELAGLMTRVAYGQSVDIHALAGIISMVGMGSNPWAVIGGATKICKEMIDKSQANVYLQKVKSLSHENTNKILLKTDQMTKQYHAVVLAAPYSPELQLNDFPDLALPPMEYKKLVVTMVHGERCGDPPIVLVENDDSNILSINRAHSVDGQNEDKHSVWKIHSKESLSEKDLSDLFVSWDAKVEKTWEMAYPSYPSVIPDGLYQLADRIYYTNIGELITSTAEFSVVSANNVATLLHSDLTNSPLKPCR